MAEVSLVSFIIVTASTDLSTMSYFSIISISPFAFQCPKYVFKFTKHSFYLFQIWQSHYSALFSFLKIVFLPKYFCSQIALIFLSTGLMSKQLVSQIVLKLWIYYLNLLFSPTLFSLVLSFEAALSFHISGSPATHFTISFYKWWPKSIS